jgi:signal transduction histidine kinase/DNA-binding response OmpR family regulator
LKEEMPNTSRTSTDTDIAISALQSAIFNSVNFSSIATDAGGVIQIFNVGAERMLGYLAAEVTNKITPADISDAAGVIARAAALSAEFGITIAPGFEALAFKASRGIEDIYELTYVRKDGSRVPAVVSVTALRDAGETVIGYLLIGTDNTGRALQQKNAELEHASRMKSEFLANMSHELRTPLNAIIGFSEILRDGLLGDLTDQQRGFIGDIFTSGKHLLALINDILDLSKVEAGKMVLDFEPVQIAQLVANSLTIVREQAATRRIQLTTNVVGDLDWMEADPRKLKQIIYNLLTNAVKFAVEGGQVTLTAREVLRGDVGLRPGAWPGRRFPLADSRFSKFLELTVADNGIGIPPEWLPSLFEPFTQIDSGLSRKFEGTGLGLAMVKLLAELHGGSVGVDSAVGQGSRFTVWLPLRLSEQTPQVSGATSAHVRAHARTAGTALVVEDDFKSAQLIRLQLEAEGFTVLHAASGEVALVMAAQQPLSLITLDITLPDIDGWDLLGRLKKLPDLRRIPVVIISMVTDRNKGFALGAAAVIEKPVSRQELYESLVDLDLFPVAAGRTVKVLVVDDDPHALELVALRIQGMASRVLRADGGRAAIALAREELPDLIVLDLMMPDVNGFDVVAALNERADTARIPILIVTAKEITGEDRARLRGFVLSIMEKGTFDRDRFIAEVRRAMSGRRVWA